MNQGPTLDTERARELLPWLLNRTLADGERSAVLDALRADAELRRELAETHWAGTLFAQHLPTADVVAYAFGEATETDRALVETHLESCAECRDELAMVRASLAERDAAEESAESQSPAVAGDVMPFTRPAERQPSTGVSPGWRLLAMAAGLAAVVGLGGWLTSLQQGASRQAALTAQVDDLATSLRAASVDTPRGNLVGAVALSADRVRAASLAAPTLVLSSDAGPVELRLESPSGPPAALYELRLRRTDGSELLRITPLTPNDQQLLLGTTDAALLPPGDLTAHLYRFDASEGWQEIEHYAVRVVHRDPATLEPGASAPDP